MNSREHLEHLESLWLLERDEERRRHVDERERLSHAERVEAGDAMSGLLVEDTASSAGNRVLVWLEAAADDVRRFSGSVGAPVTLWWGSDDDERIPGILSRKRGGRLAVTLDDFPPERLLHGHFNLDLEAPETTFRRGKRAIEDFASVKPTSDAGKLREALFGDSESERFPGAITTFFDERLNEVQRHAVEEALFTEPVGFIHGPPGTGKTRTLVELIRQALARGERVLATAASNAAVDHLAEGLLEAGVDKLVRIGHPARVSESIEAHSLDALLEARPEYSLARGWMDEARELHRRLGVRKDRGNISRDQKREMYLEARQLMSDARDHLGRIEHAIISSARVICVTASSARSRILRDERFDLAVFDEATQCADPLALIALSKTRRAVFAGDPNQLGPTVLSQKAERGGLGKTALDRHAREASMLVVQYRMNDPIMAFPSASKYEGKLVADEAVSSHRLEELGVAHDPARDSALVFVDTAGKGWNEVEGLNDASLSNPGQAERSAREARRLLSRGLAPENLAIITPYRAQARLIGDLLADVEGLEVDTIDAFQGREKEAVIVDLVRSNESGQIGFLNDTRRMNVALTRARRFLLVVGDSATIGGSDYYSDFMKAVEAHGEWLSAWTDDAEPL